MLKDPAPYRRQCLTPPFAACSVRQQRDSDTGGCAEGDRRSVRARAEAGARPGHQRVPGAQAALRPHPKDILSAGPRPQPAWHCR
ncbi:MAG: hypothetical protein MMC33_010875, partial [Icmadophila ericetorum]|nr:hypothetical protein [Icmadophila ericetorum]